MKNEPKILLSLEELQEYLKQEFPQITHLGNFYFLESVEAGVVKMRFEAEPKIHIRPGGTISGPAMFALADYAAYAVVLAHVGKKALSVTTNLNINFMRKPEPPTLIATAKLMKLGKRLAVVDIIMQKPKSNQIITHATATYSIAP